MRDKLDDFFILRESIELFLGKNKLAVEFDLEYAPSGFNKLGFRAELFLEVVRQTGGAGLVVSHAAIGNFETHRGFSFFCVRVNHITKGCLRELLAPGLLIFIQKSWSFGPGQKT